MSTPPEKKPLSIYDRSPIARWVLRRPSPYPPKHRPPRTFPDAGPALAKAARGYERWAGPRVFRRTTWRKQVLEVTGTLAAIARANRPLASGVEAAFAEETKGGRAFEIQLARARGIIAALIAAALLIWIGFSLEDLITDVRSRFEGPGYFNRGLLDENLVIVFVTTLVVSLVVYYLFRYGLVRSGRARLLAALYARLSDGQPLSEAMRGLHRFFPRHYADLVAAGERSGNLAESLTWLESESADRLNQTRRSRAHFYYLGFVLIAGTAITLFVAVKVLPVFVEILEEFGKDTSPYPVLAIIRNLGDALVYRPSYFFWQAMQLVGIVALFLLLRWLGRVSGINAMLSTLWARFTYPGHTGALRSLYHASTLLGRELEAGIPMDESLGHVCEAELLPAHRRIFAQARRRVQQGEPLGASLRAYGRGLVPASFIAFIELGETSGRLPESLRQASDLYWPVIAARSNITRTVVLSGCVLLTGGAVFSVVHLCFAMLTGMTEAMLDAL
ncbi:MAG: hypothetical protein GC168_16865 [Candidatus Hydrogenedens sp.]|nr:hypothetical protein [Candidatus Hydrogenedens sp.]